MAATLRRVPVVTGVFKQLAPGPEQRVVDAPCVDADSGQVDLLHGAERDEHLAPQGSHVPVQRFAVCDRRVREAVDLVDRQDPGSRGAPGWRGRFRLRGRTQDTPSLARRPYDIAPYAQPRSLDRRIRSQESNAARAAALKEDYEHLARQLARRGGDIESLVQRAMAFRVAVPSWGVGAGGTRFARFGIPGEPRTIFEKLDDCEAVFRLTRVTPGISLHIPWDKPENARELRAFAQTRGLFFDSMNSNTFQDQPGQPLSYKFGSLSHTDAAVRRQAVEHNLECLEIGEALGARSHTVWIGDGGNFPGQLHFRRALDRYLDSLREIYHALPADWRLFIEHKFYEPAFYSTVLNDWGTSYYCAKALGERAFSLVDLGHHAPNVNVEMIVSRLIQFGKLGGFHFNDSQYGDDDLDAGAIKPFQLFLIFNELVDAERSAVPGFAPAYMLDQSHNVTDPIESLVTSSVELVAGVRAGASRRSRGAGSVSGCQRSSDGAADAEAGLHDRRDACPCDGASPHGRCHRSDRDIQVERIPAAESRGASGEARSSAGIV